MTKGRAKSLDCDPDAPPGSVFAYEVTQEEDTVFTTYPYSFQDSEPVVISRFVLSLPPAWEARASIFNHADIQPKVEGNTYSWELRDLPWIEREDYSPGFESIAPWIGVTYFPTRRRKPVASLVEGLASGVAMALRFHGSAGGTNRRRARQSGRIDQRSQDRAGQDPRHRGLRATDQLRRSRHESSPGEGATLLTPPNRCSRATMAIAKTKPI